MQNKANLQDSQMNVTYVKTNNLQQKTMNYEPIKQTQSKPISLVTAGPKNTWAASAIPSPKPPLFFQAKLFSRKEVFYFCNIYGLARNVFKKFLKNLKKSSRPA